MRKIQNGGPDRPVIIGLVVALAALAVVVAVWLRRSETASGDRETAAAPPMAAISAPEPSPSATPPAEPKPESVIRYDDPDPDFQELMRRRKAEFGLENGVDMIVREDETLRIGDTVVPMSEIMERIRIQKGGVVESDLSTASRHGNRRIQIDEMFGRLKAAEDRFRELDERLTGGGEPPPEETVSLSLAELKAEHERLSGIVEDFRMYRRTLRDIHEGETLLSAPEPKSALAELLESLRNERTARIAGLPSPAPGSPGEISPESEAAALESARARLRDVERELTASPAPDAARLAALRAERASLREAVGAHETIREIDARIAEYERLAAADGETLRKEIERRLSALRQERDDLENALVARVIPEERVDLFGVYVVRSGDNIWNIHFQFLTEYFSRRGVTLSSRADEPLRPGVSSGVGKILKFAENMVYIYNIRERRLSFDLNQIQPLSKIVIFNMGQVFQMLDQISYENIRSIRYDGENLWIPAS